VANRASNERYTFLKKHHTIAHILFKIYQINFHRLLVIDDSLSDVETRSIHPGYGLDDGEVTSQEARDSTADRAMVSFRVKRIKLDNDRTSKSAVANTSGSSPACASSSTHNIPGGSTPSVAASSQPIAQKSKQSTRSAGKAKAGSSTKSTPLSADTISDKDVTMGGDFL